MSPFFCTDDAEGQTTALGRVKDAKARAAVIASRGNASKSSLRAERRGGAEVWSAVGSGN